MHVGSILVGFVLLAALGAVVARPWWQPTVVQRAVRTPSADHHAEYEALVAAIRDLDFDYRAGVVTEVDYRPLRDNLAARAVALMQELDRQPSEEADTSADSSIEEQIEAAVSALRTHRYAEQRSTGAGEWGSRGAREQGSKGEFTPAPLHPGTRAQFTPAPQPPSTHARVVCPECEHPVRAGSRFCAQCGATLEGTCPDCGASVEPDDRFCGTCGQSLVKVMA